MQRRPYINALNISDFFDIPSSAWTKIAYVWWELFERKQILRLAIFNLFIA